MNPRRPSGREDAGFTVVAVLILVSLMASLAATFSRHVIVDAQASAAATTMSESAELIDSQTDFMLQSHRLGWTFDQAKVVTAMDAGRLGGSEYIHKTTKQITEGSLADGTHSTLLSSIRWSSGLGATRLIETVRVPATLTSAPSELPVLDADVAWDVLNDPTVEVREVHSSQTFSGGDFEGVLIIHEGAVLTLDDVIIRGTVMSASAALGTVPESYSSFLAPKLVIAGMVRILADGGIPDVAILMPDGAVTAENTLARVQIQGDVVAHSLHLLTSGSFEGNLATVVDPVIASGIDRIGDGRSPRDWADALGHHGAWQLRSIATVPTELTLDDVTAITGFTLPGSSGGAGR